jgi:hypothetical protein
MAPMENRNMDDRIFVTHTGEAVTGERLEQAFNKVADFFESNARKIREEDPYAAHVTEETKDELLNKRLASVQRIREGEVRSFTVWQRINTELTGKCVAMLP